VIMMTVWLLTCQLFQHVGSLEQKVAALESQIHSVDCDERGTYVSNNIEHLEGRLRRAEAELADMQDNQRCSELQENHKVTISFSMSSLASHSPCSFTHFSYTVMQTKQLHR